MEGFVRKDGAVSTNPRKYPAELKECSVRLVREVRRANGILLAASSFFAREQGPRLPW